MVKRSVSRRTGGGRGLAGGLHGLEGLGLFGRQRRQVKARKALLQTQESMPVLGGAECVHYATKSWSSRCYFGFVHHISPSAAPTPWAGARRQAA